MYRLYDGPDISYIGSSEDISKRLKDHEANPRFDKITSFDFLKTDTTKEARELEQRQIKQYTPPQNHTL